MKLKQCSDLAGFLNTVKMCRGEVYYHTTEGDILNLKSQLSQYLFLAVLSSKNTVPAISEGEIVCANSTDYAQLSAFLQE